MLHWACTGTIYFPDKPWVDTQDYNCSTPTGFYFWFMPQTFHASGFDYGRGRLLWLWARQSACDG